MRWGKVWVVGDKGLEGIALQAHVMEYYRFRFNPPTCNLVVRFRNLLQGRNLSRYGVTLAELKEADQQDDDVEVSQEQRRPNPQRNAPYTVYEDKKVLRIQVGTTSEWVALF